MASKCDDIEDEIERKNCKDKERAKATGSGSVRGAAEALLRNRREKDLRARNILNNSK